MCQAVPRMEQPDATGDCACCAAPPPAPSPPLLLVLWVRSLEAAARACGWLYSAWKPAGLCARAALRHSKSVPLYCVTFMCVWMHTDAWSVRLVGRRTCLGTLAAPVLQARLQRVGAWLRTWRSVCNSTYSLAVARSCKVLMATCRSGNISFSLRITLQGIPASRLQLRCLQMQSAKLIHALR
jgi:hypothetical protein